MEPLMVRERDMYSGEVSRWRDLPSRLRGRDVDAHLGGLARVACALMLREIHRKERLAAPLTFHHRLRHRVRHLSLLRRRLVVLSHGRAHRSLCRCLGGRLGLFEVGEGLCTRFRIPRRPRRLGRLRHRLCLGGGIRRRFLRGRRLLHRFLRLPVFVGPLVQALQLVVMRLELVKVDTLRTVRIGSGELTIDEALVGVAVLGEELMEKRQEFAAVEMSRLVGVEELKLEQS